jgi:2-oxoisovalerate dehydrogenase E1 component
VFDTLLDENIDSRAGQRQARSAASCRCPRSSTSRTCHNAEDQLRGEAATLSFFSNGQYRNGLVVASPGTGYQEGFGGHFHNDDAIAVLRDIPGLVIASPSRPDDARRC